MWWGEFFVHVIVHTLVWIVESRDSFSGVTTGGGEGGGCQHSFLFIINPRRTMRRSHVLADAPATAHDRRP